MKKIERVTVGGRGGYHPSRDVGVCLGEGGEIIKASVMSELIPG